MNSYTSQENTISYININNKIIKIDRYCPICNNLFNLDNIKEDIYSDEDGESII
jgi:hypothetical protein